MKQLKTAKIVKFYYIFVFLYRSTTSKILSESPPFIS